MFQHVIKITNQKGMPLIGHHAQAWVLHKGLSQKHQIKVWSYHTINCNNLINCLSLRYFGEKLRKRNVELFLHFRHLGLPKTPLSYLGSIMLLRIINRRIFKRSNTLSVFSITEYFLGYRNLIKLKKEQKYPNKKSHDTKYHAIKAHYYVLRP